MWMDKTGSTVSARSQGGPPSARSALYSQGFARRTKLYQSFPGCSGENSSHRVFTGDTGTLLHADRKGTETETRRRGSWHCHLQLLPYELNKLCAWLCIFVDIKRKKKMKKKQCFSSSADLARVEVRCCPRARIVSQPWETHPTTRIFRTPTTRRPIFGSSRDSSRGIWEKSLK